MSSKVSSLVQFNFGRHGGIGGMNSFKSRTPASILDYPQMSSLIPNLDYYPIVAIIVIVSIDVANNLISRKQTNYYVLLPFICI